MPLEQRVIAPIWVSRGCFELNQHHPHYLQGSNQQINVANELECVTNGTLSNIIRQLSSLSRHAEDLFGSLLHETSGLVQRSVNLKQRLDILTEKVERLSDAGPDQPVGTIGKKPFKSKADNFDQEIVARSTIPVSLREVYERCDPPPCLSKLNQFRDDNLDGLQLYTNPNYFFELWKNDMLAGKGKSSKKDSHSSSAKKSKSRNSSSRHQSIDAGKAVVSNVHYHVQHPQNHNAQQMIMNQGPNSRTSLASGDMPYSVYNDNNSVLQQQAYAQQQQQQKIYGQVPAQGPNQPIYGYQGQVAPGTYEQGYENNVYNQQYVQQNRPNSLELSQQQYYNRLEYFNQQQQQQYGVYGNNQQPQQQQQQQQIYGQNNQYQNQQGSPMGTPTKRAPGVSRPSVAPPAPPPGAPGSQPSTPVKGRMMNGNMSDGNPRDSLPPPPPPPPMMDEMPPPPPPQVGNSGAAPPPPPPMPETETGFAPPPPPPPPPPVPANNIQNRSLEAPKKPAVSNSLAKPTAEMLQSVKLKKTEPKTNNGGNDDERSNLLAAIRQGIKLKRVEETRKEVEKTAPLHDVASILARRVAMQMSDSEGEGKNNDSEESDGWDDDSEC